MAHIQLKTSPRGEWEEVEVEKGIRVEQLYKERIHELPYTIIAAKVDNEFQDLSFLLNKSCKVELLDIRTQAANLIYQYSLSLLYIKAVKDCIGDVRVEIQNSLNKGLYTEIKTPDLLTEDQVKSIEQRMRELVEKDIPFAKGSADIEEGIEILKEEGLVEKIRLLDENKDLKKITFYSIGGYKDFFYGLMVPSTGYVKYFELKKYRRGVLLRFPHPSNPDNSREKLYNRKNKGDEIMRIGAIVGNPPYQMSVGNQGGNKSKAKSVYHLFIKTGISIGSDYMSLITPSRWMTLSTEGIPKSFVEFMINSNKIQEMIDYEDASSVFPNVAIKGGVSYFLYSRKYYSKCKYTYFEVTVLHKIFKSIKNVTLLM